MCLRLRERWHLLPYVWGDAPVCVCSSERLFIFLLHEQKKNETKRKFAGCIFLPTPALFYAKQKELASLKQLFVFNAPKSTSASRSKSEAGPLCSFATLLRSLMWMFSALWRNRERLFVNIHCCSRQNNEFC